ncbi:MULTISPECIES: DUF1206 domain-containing protein, partial [Cyanophyceae]|uniref:DUF1206 domain-containing protein n=1 Tax=Cyanophyceae TaxID=3028117 RepID=UPI0016835AD9
VMNRWLLCGNSSLSCPSTLFHKFPAAIGFHLLLSGSQGVSFLYEAYTAKFRKHFKLLNMSKAQIQWATWLGRFGISARGAAFGLIGLLVIQAALQDDPGEVQGLGGSLQALAEEALGQWILGAIAFGFMAYSLYMLIQARYRRIDPP